MKRFLLFIGLLLSSIHTGISADVWIEVDGIESIEGNIEVLMYHELQKSSWPEGEHYTCLDKKIVTSHAETLICEDIKPGRYAVSVLHDANANGKMDKRLIFPVESYGFSNNTKNLIGLSTFDKSSFQVDSLDVSLKVTLFTQ